MKEPPSATVGTTPEESVGCTVEALPVMTPVQRRSPEVRAQQQRKVRERMQRHEARMTSIREPKPSPRSRGNVGCRVRVTSMSRSRSREQPHAPRTTARSTPKAAQRSGDSGDSSDPPGAALAATLPARLPLRGVDLVSAILRVRVTSGAVRTFDAESVTTEAGLVTAVGRWRHHRGRHHRYSWASGRVLEIRWGVVA